MSLRISRIRLLVSVASAFVIGFFGFAGFVQGIHDATSFSKALFVIGLPLLAFMDNAEVFWLPIIGSIILWVATLYVAITLLTRIRD